VRKRNLPFFSNMVNTMTVVNDYSVHFPQEIYEFHKQQGIVYMQFIPCVENDPQNPCTAASFSVSSTEYGIFLCRLFDLWKADFCNGIPTTSIRFFDSAILSYMNAPPEECTFFEECDSYMVIEHNGDVYPCDFFVEHSHKLGNVHSNNLLEILHSDKQKKFGRSKKSLPAKCLKCPWLKQCNGGCLKDRVRDLRDRGMNHFCEATKMFYQYAHVDLKKLAEHFAKILNEKEYS